MFTIRKKDHFNILGILVQRMPNQRMYQIQYKSQYKINLCA
jgi:hypothetical protein